MLDEKAGIKELSVEYFIISIYLLIRHLCKFYVVDDNSKNIIKNFVYDFHSRWKTYDESVDIDLLTFSIGGSKARRMLKQEILYYANYFLNT